MHVFLDINVLYLRMRTCCVVLQVWDRKSYSLVKTLPTQNHWVRSLQVSGKYLYSGSYQAVKVSTVHHLP